MDKNMIINTGCRTDIPAFYSKWFINITKTPYGKEIEPHVPDKAKSPFVSKMSPLKIR